MVRAPRLERARTFLISPGGRYNPEIRRTGPKGNQFLIHRIIATEKIPTLKSRKYLYILSFSISGQSGCQAFPEVFIIALVKAIVSYMQRITAFGLVVFSFAVFAGVVPAKTESNANIPLTAGVVQQIVESVDISGNRRLRDEDLLYYIKTRAGDVYDPAALERDQHFVWKQRERVS